MDIWHITTHFVVEGHIFVARGLRAYALSLAKGWTVCSVFNVAGHKIVR